MDHEKLMELAKLETQQLQIDHANAELDHQVLKDLIAAVYEGPSFSTGRNLAAELIRRDPSLKPVTWTSEKSIPRC